MEEETGDEDEEGEFARACGILCDVYTAIFRNLLHCQLPPSDCVDVANKIRNIGSKHLCLTRKIAADGNYAECDILLAYLLLIRGCPNIPLPTAGWGVTPVTGTTIGDDIQRMWEMKTYILSRRHLRSLEKGKYKDLTKLATDICQRLDSEDVRFDILYAPFPSCFMMLKTILESPRDKAVHEICLQHIDDLREMENEIAKEKKNFAKMCQVVMDLNPLILQDILDEQLPWIDCPREAAKLSPKPLRPDQLAIANNVPSNGYTECDTSLMYILLRNACKHIPPPTPKWDRIPTGFGIGDDIERIRQTRNSFGHASCATLSSLEYNTFMTATKDICQRFDTAATHCSFTKPSRENYVQKLCAIETQTLDKAQEERYVKLLMEKNENERNIVDAVLGVHLEMASTRKLVEGLRGKTLYLSLLN